MKSKLVCVCFAAIFSICCFAEEDPSYEPFNGTRPAPPPKRAISLTDTPAPAPSASKTKSKTPRAQETAPVPPPIEYTQPVVSAPPVPTGPKVKYILNGKPVYEGDPDPIPPVGTPAAPRNAYDSRSVNISVTPPTIAPATNTYPPSKSVRLDFASDAPPRVVAPSAPRPLGTGTVADERKVKYILDGRPVYEGDPDPILAAKNGAPITMPAYSPPIGNTRGSPLDDVTADKPVAGGKPGQEVRGQLVLEEFTAPGQVNSRAKKAYIALGDMKQQLESMSRLMENRGKQNALLIHTSDDLLDSINQLGAVWPRSPAFIDVCSTAKRSALLYNSELNEVPWTWTRVRWTFDTMVKDVRALRLYAKTMAESEPAPLPVVLKNGTIVYQDAPDMSVDAATAKREAVMKATREEMARLNRTNSERAERREDLKIDLDGNTK